MYGEHCAECPLRGTADPLSGRGPETARFVVVTGLPPFKPADYGKLLPSGAMTLMSRMFQDEGFAKEDFYFHPAVRCPHDPDIFTTKEKAAAAKACRNYCDETIQRIRPKVTVPLGGDACKQVFGRAVKITQVRGVPDKVEGIRGLVLPMLNPMQAVLYPQHKPTMVSDVATLGRLVDHGYNVTQASRAALGDYEIIEDLQFLVDARPEILAYDTENTSLRWFQPGPEASTYDSAIHGPDWRPGAAILTMQFSIEEGKGYLLPWDHPDAPRTPRQKARLKKQLRQLMCHDEVTIVGQNAKYDCAYTYAQTGIRYRIGGDTLMLAAIHDENAVTKNLDDLVKRFVPAMAGYADRFNATVDKSRMWELPLDRNFVDYGCGDADGTLRLYNALYPVIEEDERLLAHYYYVTLPGLNAFVSMELRGQHIDETHIAEFEAVMEAEVERQRLSLLRQVPRSIKRLHVEKGLKFSRKDFLLDILFRHPDGFKLKPKVFTKTTARLDADRKVPSTSSKDHLPYFYDDCPFTFELSEYVKQERILSTNVKGFQNKYLVDAMVRPTYSLHRTVTGRTASEDPNGQNYPKRGPIAKEYRKLFIAPEGYFYLEADLSQAELRIAGDMANDPTMIRIYREKGDIHTATALIVMSITMEEFRQLSKDEQKAARTKAKAVNFGFLYGMGWRKFVAYAKTQYGAVFTDKEAQRVREAFFDTYYKLPEWHRSVRAFAGKNGFVRSYSGRLRHLPMIWSEDEGVRAEAERQAINSPVQEFGSSLGVMSIGRINEEVDPEYLSIVGFVHDAIYAYVPKQYIEWGAKTLRYYMQSNPLEEWFGRRMKVPIIADASIGENLGEMYELGEFECGDDGEVAVGTYDFGKLWEKEPDKALYIPRQKIPRNNGRLVESIYR